MAGLLRLIDRFPVVMWFGDDASRLEAYQQSNPIRAHRGGHQAGSLSRDRVLLEDGKASLEST